MGISIDLFPIGNTKKDPIKQIVGNVPTNLDTLEEISQNTIAADTIGYRTTTTDISLEFETLDGKSSGSVTFPSATTKQAGVMSAGDKKNLDNVPSTIKDAIAKESKATDEKIAKEKTRAEAVEQTLVDDIANAPNLALRSLFVAAGAEYNDTDSVKEVKLLYDNDFGGTKVQHLPHHYLLNSIGNITEDEMLAIYMLGKFNKSDAAPLANAKVRTNLGRKGMANGEQIDTPRLAYAAECETINLCEAPIYEGTFPTKSSEHFLEASKLRAIYGRLILDAYYATMFKNCIALERVKILNLSVNVSLKDSPLISKHSLLYMVKNAMPTSSITITLHPDAYARLADDAEIVAALEAQPLVSLVSA